MAEMVIHGTCPHCKKNTKLRELTFTENLLGIGSFVGGFLTGGLSGKAKHSAALVNSFSDARQFPNYKCGNCGKDAMQCSACKALLPYEHDGTSHICGARDAEKSDPQQKTDVLSKLERLAALKEKGVLTESEFNEQKKRILGN